MKRKKIPEFLHETVFKWYSEGKTSDQISALLKEEYDITVGKTAVNNVLITIKEERRQISQSIYADACKNNASQDVYLLSDILIKLYEDFNNLRDVKDLKSSRTTAETIIKYISKRIDLSGLNSEKIENKETTLTQAIINKLADIKNE